MTEISFIHPGPFANAYFLEYHVHAILEDPDLLGGIYISQKEAHDYDVSKPQY